MSPTDATDPDRDENMAELLDDLESTLTDLRTELRGETEPERNHGTARGSNRRTRPGSGPDFPRPPSVSELLGFTEQYTLPTLIATLEATIRALELLRGTIRLVNPDRSGVEPSSDQRRASPTSRLGTGAAGVGREAVSGVERALSELEAALADADLPEDRASNELLGEARDLSAKVRERLEAAQAAGTTDRTGRRRAGEDRRDAAEPGPDADAVTIGVTNGDDTAKSDANSDDQGDEDRPDVDIEGELASIKDEVRGADGADPADETEQSSAENAESAGKSTESANGGKHSEQSGDDGESDQTDGRDGQ